MAEPTPAYSIVTEAELRSFAEQQSWDVARRQQTAFLLGYFNRMVIEDERIIEAYVLLDNYSRRLSTGAIKMGKNDLWIAATAYVLKAVLVTTDKDFDHLDGKYLIRLLIS